MSNTLETIYNNLPYLTLSEKIDLIVELSNQISAEVGLPAKSYLQSQWDLIQNWIHDLSLEPYIDDQWEIEEIWNTIDEIIKSGKIKEEDYSVREPIIKSIIDNEFYDYYGVYDPMKDLLQTCILTDEEKLKYAKYLA